MEAQRAWQLRARHRCQREGGSEEMKSLLVIATLAGVAQAAPDDPIAKYFSQLESMKLIDAESGTLASLKRELQIAENLLNDGAYTNAAVALYAIVKSPRYSAFTDFVEFQNAEYDLGVALSRAAAYG